MTTHQPHSVGQIFEHQPTSDTFRQDVVDGLSRPQKELPCKYFYDQRGSDLFEQICQLDEYYLTRVELAIMRDHAVDMARAIGPRGMIIEFGLGSGLKTQLLLEALERPVACVPIDISRSALMHAAQSIAARFPQLEVMPVCADFTKSHELPMPSRPFECCIVYFPGSTIGNFSPDACEAMLGLMAKMTAGPGGVLIGIDLKKDVAVLEAAYNDRKGITRQFNLNILIRANRELGTDFDLNAFGHRSHFCPMQDCIEMHLVSLKDQVVHVGHENFSFAAGESILTERSYKYTVEDFARTAGKVGLQLNRCWTDDADQFGVLYLRRSEERTASDECHT